MMEEFKCKPGVGSRGGWVGPLLPPGPRKPLMQHANVITLDIQNNEKFLGGGFVFWSLSS